MPGLCFHVIASEAISLPRLDCFVTLLWKGSSQRREKNVIASEAKQSEIVFSFEIASLPFSGRVPRKDKERK